MLNNLKLISAGAGSGKTYRLTQEMAGLLTDGSVRPSGIIATTFTKRAAAELKERVRVKLLREGMTQEANALSGALIGTVHGLGVKLLRRFAYEAGVSPQVDIIGDGDDQRLFNLSMAAVIDLDQIRCIELLCDKLGLSRNGEKYNWRKDVLGLVEIIRGNNFQAADIKRSKENSWHTLRLFLPPPAENLTLEQYHTRIQRVLKETYEALYANDADGTKKTETAAGNLRSLLRTLKQRDYLPWLEYAKMGRYEKEVGAKSRDLVADLVALGEQHAALPAFQEDLRGYQDLIFDCAAASIKEYDTYKKNRGRIDYTDMEVLVLKLLDHPSVQETLTRELDLLMVDEFQDTSPIQLAIFLRLSQLAKQSIWVGDPKQSIYGFRGAEPRLMAAVMNANGTIDPANIQTDSWRSREDIVYTCNSLFVSAFPEFKPAEVALDPVRRRKGSKFSPVESAELSEQSGLIHWHFEVEGKGRYRKDFMYATLSKAIRELLANPPAILPKGATEERPLRAGDIAVLCRANYTCNEVAEAISRQGINAAIQRTGLLATAESTLLLACLKYMLNGSDSLSVAEIMLFGGRRPLAEIIDHRLDYLGTEGEKPNWGAGEELLQQLDGLRDITSEHSTSEMLNLVLERTDLRRIAAAWGDGEQRLGNLDELRRLAVAYEDNCHRQHRAASLGGYLLYLDQLIRDGQDKQGASERPDAVNVLTYHRSKGLEWPAVICFDLDQSLRADVWGRAVIPNDAEAPVDLANPLANRWLRYWVNPYDRLAGGIPWVDALNESDWKKQTETDALAEEARLLYVGFTRARDYLILPTGKNGAPWVDRVYGRGGTKTVVLSPATTETPFSWDGHDIDKTNKPYVEPQTQPRSEAVYSALPFIHGTRPGHATHTVRAVDDTFLLEHFGASQVGQTIQYHSAPDLDPDTDARAAALCLSCFTAGDPGSSDPGYREEVAQALIDEFRPGGNLQPHRLLDAATAHLDYLSSHQLTARIDRNVEVRGMLTDREYCGRVDFLGELADGSLLLISDVCLAPKQYLKQSATRLAELRLQAQLVGSQTGKAVSTALLHLPVNGTFVEVIL